MDTIRWGILATGWIADQLAEAITASEDGEIVAVGSRTQARADAFADKWGIPNRYADYAALAADPAVDIIYIATPHSHHYANMQLCLNAGKHVLCEKAFTLNSREAAECIALARKRGLFLMEAMWMRYFPAIAQVRDWVATGAIGDVRLVQAAFCFHLPFDPAHRLYDPALGGGALLDLGIYPLSFATFMLGQPDAIHGETQYAPTGVDGIDTFTLVYPNAAAQLTCSMQLNRPREAFVVGTRGYIKLHETFYHPHRLTLAVDGQPPQTIELPYRGNGYIYEVEEVHACLRAGRLESERMPLDESYQLMALMDRLRADWGIVYPGERA